MTTFTPAVPPHFWKLASGERPDQKIVVQLTPRAANWLRSLEVKKHYNSRTLHTKDSAAALADKIKGVVDAIDGSFQVGTTYGQSEFPSHLFPRKNRIEALPAEIKGYLLEHADDLDLSAAQPTILRWICEKVFRIAGQYACDRGLFADEDCIPAPIAKQHINAVWNAEQKRRGPKWYGFRDFENSCHRARELLYRAPELEEIRDHVQVKKGGSNILGSFASHVYAFVMGKLLHAVQAKLEKDLGAVVQGLASDGLRVVKGIPKEDLVATAQAACEQVCPGIHAVWKVKPPETEIKDAGDKKGSGCHLRIALADYESVYEDEEDDLDGPPVETLTDGQLQSMDKLFRTPLGTVGKSGRARANLGASAPL